MFERCEKLTVHFKYGGKKTFKVTDSFVSTCEEGVQVIPSLYGDDYAYINPASVYYVHMSLSWKWIGFNALYRYFFDRFSKRTDEQ